MSEWRDVEYRIQVVGSPQFIADPDSRFEPISAFRAEMLVLRGEVRGPNVRDEWEVRVHENNEVATVLLTGQSIAAAKIGAYGADDRALYLAATILRAPRAAHRERLMQLRDASRFLLPLLPSSEPETVR